MPQPGKRLRAAALALAAEDHVVLVDPERRHPGDVVDHELEAIVAERLDAAAIAAHEMVVMVSAGLGRLVLSAARSKLDLAHESELVQCLEGAVDARDSDAGSPPPDAVVKLWDGEAAAFTRERSDHG